MAFNIIHCFACHLKECFGVLYLEREDVLLGENWRNPQCSVCMLPFGDCWRNGGNPDLLVQLLYSGLVQRSEIKTGYLLPEARDGS